MATLIMIVNQPVFTIQYIQKKDPKYKEAKEDTAWSMDRFNDYINRKVAPVKGLEEDWVYGSLTVSNSYTLDIAP